MSNNGSSSSCSIQHHQIKQQEEDRLSSLPDNLLITILSLLPINSAAATSALSRRWPHLWTHLTHLFLDFHYHEFESAVTIINHIFSQLKSPKIHTFYLNLMTPYSTEIYSSFLVPWFDHICLRNPEVIKVSYVDCTIDYRKLFQIPNCLFETQSLVQLELDVRFEFEFLSIKLPNLKKLALKLYDPHIPLIGRNGPLFKACPLLEDLNLTLYFTEDDNVDHIVDISTPNLKLLRLHVMADDFEDCKLVIDAPNLEKFYIDGVLTFYEFVKNPSNLQEAEISITENSSGADYDYMSKIPGLIRGISCVRSLDLQYYGTHVLDSISDLGAPLIFHNLIYLSLCYNSFHCIDKLPRCSFFGNLKRVDIENAPSDDGGINLVQHILSYATVLEKLLVHFHVGWFLDESQEQEEYEFCNKLFLLSKSSFNCQIELWHGDLCFCN